MAKGWLRALRETPSLRDNVIVVGLVDLDRQTAEALASEFDLSGVAIGTDLPAVLSQTNPDILFDVVVPAARRSVVAAGLAHGCHVLSEKPMAMSLDEARELRVLADRAGKLHAIVQNRRYIAGVRRIRRLIEDGALGRLTGLHCDFFLGPHFGGFREQMANVLLLDMAIHTFDAARFISGKDPLTVYCHEHNPPGSWYRHGAAANAIFEFSDDVVFTYRGSWCAEGAPTSWESAWRITGTQGTILWDGAEKFEANVVIGRDGFFRSIEPVGVPVPENESETHGHASVIESFITAIRVGGRPETDGSDNIKSLAMVFGAIDSARDHRRVTIAA
ncbi:Gfo/Idh/MocA family oxidoreductase [Rhizobiaceae bacterium n13]|uniref:Gfo/Idh/MocA family oxidoreductase n=1 Tax=Ferirhizobium litorale TaxID=2927786 RepID=A0AAE3QC32_9HYPH|nr:Gfo/Idh/MocA family oxidoreductase [Fererhizobium litorale]MDI7922096.1 Gfo/Idh/MocA family oxidoreductase [Fererhizobium litorale]